MSSKLSQILHKIVKSTIHLKPTSSIEAGSIIKEHLVSQDPCMIARFGSTEIKAIIYPNTPFFLKGVLKKMMNYNATTKEFSNMKILSGFFPSNSQTITRFSELMYQDMKLLDVLGSWRFEERFLVSHFKKSTIVKLDALEPYLQKNPWSEALEGKKVLVIHPFNKTIEQQYHNKRTLLFRDPRVLPAFASLQTIKAVQTLAGNKVAFKDWFEALDFMKKQIDQKDFDIAIIGAGAYGFPLAAHIKRMGKKAIHMGGPTQMLFGIKGKRWVDNPKFKDIINEHFIVPSDEDVIKDATKVEDGCYW
ncbi:MAG: hypothetical protein GW772_02045 [Flavobacteriia bacterium]|nr:hypothetical protein [Flavobacteriia bacterium]OIP47588.1 MAG: hypothetical protein AUK46_04840 [Flavobacteriaceae bacterium CG2_30_31_66]